MKDVVGGLNHRSGNTRTEGTTTKRTAKTIPIRDNRLLENLDHPRNERAFPLSTVSPEPIPANRNKSPGRTAIHNRHTHQGRRSCPSQGCGIVLASERSYTGVFSDDTYQISSNRNRPRCNPDRDKLRSASRTIGSRITRSRNKFIYVGKRPVCGRHGWWWKYCHFCDW